MKGKANKGIMWLNQQIIPIIPSSSFCDKEVVIWMVAAIVPHKTNTQNCFKYLNFFPCKTVRTSATICYNRWDEYSPLYTRNEHQLKQWTAKGEFVTKKRIHSHLYQNLLPQTSVKTLKNNLVIYETIISIS